jgi:hypothetical protein
MFLVGSACSHTIEFVPHTRAFHTAASPIRQIYEEHALSATCPRVFNHTLINQPRLMARGQHSVQGHIAAENLLFIIFMDVLKYL